MDGGQWGPGFLLLEWEVTDKKGEEARTHQEVTDESYGCQHELSFSLV